MFYPLGYWSDLSAPLRHVADDARLGGDADSPVNGDENRDGEAVRGGRVMVMFSDGRDSAGVADAAEIATRLADAGWQVHTVGVGSVEESPDLGVVDVDVPERVADDGRLAGLIWVKHYGYDGGKARVQIRSGDEVVWSDVVDLRGDGKTSVQFDFAVESLMRRAMESDVRGVDRDSVALSLTASVSSVAGPVGADSSPRDSSQSTSSFRGNGSDRSNDSMSFRVAAASRHRRLLILDGSSRWEIRYLRNLFSRDPSWDVNTVLFGLGTDSPKVRRGDEEGRLPDSQRAWAGYDVVIFGEVPPDQWTRQDAMRLTQFVAGGGGMIVLDGRYGRVAELVGSEDGVTHEGTDQPSSSPVRSTSDDVSESMATLIPVRFQRDVNRRPRVQRIEPTVTGKSQPVMMLGLSDSGIEPAAGRIDTEDAFWEHLPAPSSVSRVVAQPDAEIWAEAEFVADAELVSDSVGDRSVNRTPWLVTRVFGAGRVFYLASDETWRWRYKLESRLHGRFWNQLMTAAMSPPYAASDDFVAIGTDRIDYRTGQSATIRARLLPTSSILGDSVTLPTVDALLLKDEQVVATVPMRLENAERRTYVGATDGLPEGAYRVRVRASGFDAAALKASTPIWVTPPRTRERDRLSLDETTLQRIAVAGGGIYVHESSAEELLSLIEPLSGGQIIESDTPLWQSWWGFAVIVVLLATEWWMRKKVGLI
ncbi:MAG: VWA domain-containing protein [Rhodopirellula sp. JB044]|uniref:VWA domain-containing protein n=1 Tax=Rhodopirellula sp. JB044 TaxID=3342844 RepID=UPI00370C7158